MSRFVLLISAALTGLFVLFFLVLVPLTLTPLFVSSFCDPSPSSGNAIIILSKAPNTIDNSFTSCTETPFSFTKYRNIPTCFISIAISMTDRPLDVCKVGRKTPSSSYDFLPLLAVEVRCMGQHCTSTSHLNRRPDCPRMAQWIGNLFLRQHTE